MNASRPGARLPLALFILRITVFVVMAMWTLDKFVRPTHAAAVYENFYGLSGFGAPVMYVLGALEMLLLVAFILGVMRRWTYGAVLVLHGISTFASFPAYLDPFGDSHLLFFAAWPMLGACFALFYLRDSDTLCTVGHDGQRRG